MNYSFEESYIELEKGNGNALAQQRQLAHSNEVEEEYFCNICLPCYGDSLHFHRLCVSMEVFVREILG